MAQAHGDRLTAIDASFLAGERETSHKHVGAIKIFDGPPPTPEEGLEHIYSRLHLVPRYRQKLAFPPIETGRPVWIDDPSFNLEYHVRHTALPDGTLTLGLVPAVAAGHLVGRRAFGRLSESGRYELVLTVALVAAVGVGLIGALV